MEPPRGFQHRKKKKTHPAENNKKTAGKTPNPLRSPLPRMKLKIKVGGEVPPAWTPPNPPGAPGEGGKTLCSRWEPENGDTEGGEAVSVSGWIVSHADVGEIYFLGAGGE